MYYSGVGLLALLVHLIINHDVLFGRAGKDLSRSGKPYRLFLAAVTAYYLSDIVWGFLYDAKLSSLNFLNTTVYFLTMACSILFWTRYVVLYLQDSNNRFGRWLRIFGWGFFGFQVILLAVNFFRPVMFYFDDAGEYHAAAFRYYALILQILMFLLTAVHALSVLSRSSGTMRSRHFAIGLFSLAMAGFICGQAFLPLFPMYAIGCMIGGCVMHSFVLENEKDEYRDELEIRLKENIGKGNYYDLLTGLPGMSYFFELAEQKRTALAGEGKKPAVLFLDLSGFKFYNQKHGFSAGDQLLQAFSRHLISVFSVEECSRFGQDHFAVFTDADRLESRLQEIFRLWKAESLPDCPAVRAGIYPDVPKDTDISTACDRAKAARDSIRNTYVSSFRYFDASMLENAEMKQYIISHLDQAIAERWIQVYYQPIIRAANGRVCDEEALARWIDPERGFLSPADFIPILEDAKQIWKLDLCVVDQVLEKICRMREEGLVLVPQSVNLSRADFDSCDIVDEICRRTDRAGLSHSMLTIEITESIIGQDFAFMRSQIERFRALGFPVWLDDFGSGYSSLDVLSDLEIDLLKLDMRFMQQFDQNNKSRAILTELVKLAISLGIDTVCEGVEREDQASFLRDIGCVRLQGYYFTKPLSLDRILERYRTGTQIGFENPEESGYYDSIGRINLYDLDVFTQGNSSDLRNYYSTVPMAILEITDHAIRFSRCNHAYRNFFERTFGLRISGHESFSDLAPEPSGMPFSRMLRETCRKEENAFYDETLPDGTKIHSLIRRIAVNPHNGTVAAAVAVLAVANKAES